MPSLIFISKQGSFSHAGDAKVINLQEVQTILESARETTSDDALSIMLDKALEALAKLQALTEGDGAAFEEHYDTLCCLCRYYSILHVINEDDKDTIVHQRASTTSPDATDKALTRIEVWLKQHWKTLTAEQHNTFIDWITKQENTFIDWCKMGFAPAAVWAALTLKAPNKYKALSHGLVSAGFFWLPDIVSATAKVATDDEALAFTDYMLLSLPLLMLMSAAYSKELAPLAITATIVMGMVVGTWLAAPLVSAAMLALFSSIDDAIGLALADLMDKAFILLLAGGFANELYRFYRGWVDLAGDDQVLILPQKKDYVRLTTHVSILLTLANQLCRLTPYDPSFLLALSTWAKQLTAPTLQPGQRLTTFQPDFLATDNGMVYNTSTHALVTPPSRLLIDVERLLTKLMPPGKDPVTFIGRTLQTSAAYVQQMLLMGLQVHRFTTLPPIGPSIPEGYYPLAFTTCPTDITDMTHALGLTLIHLIATQRLILKAGHPIQGFIPGNNIIKWLVEHAACYPSRDQQQRTVSHLIELTMLAAVKNIHTTGQITVEGVSDDATETETETESRATKAVESLPGAIVLKPRADATQPLHLLVRDECWQAVAPIPTGAAIRQEIKGASNPVVIFYQEVPSIGGAITEVFAELNQ